MTRSVIVPSPSASNWVYAPTSKVRRRADISRSNRWRHRGAHSGRGGAALPPPGDRDSNAHGNDHDRAPIVELVL